MNHKFVIWGAGKFCSWILAAIGTDRIVGIIDSNETLYGTDINGITIFSYETYKTKYIDYPIIISPKNYEDKIYDKLQSDGIYWCFKFYHDCLLDLEGFLWQAPKEKLIRSIQKKSVILSDFNLLSIILYDYFIDKGFECSLYIGNINNVVLLEYIRNILKIPIKSEHSLFYNKDCIILTKKSDRFFSDYERYDYSELGLQKKLYNYEILSKFKNIHLGKRCFIVATGPSLKMDDLERLKINNECCISCNGIIKVFDQTKWRPDYYCLSDPFAFMSYKNELLNSEKEIKAKFFWDNACNYENEYLNYNIYKIHGLRDVEPICFSDDITKFTCWGFTVVYDIALQLAAYMGFCEIYLLGVDMNYSSIGSNYCYREENKSNNNSFNYDTCMKAFETAKQYADSHGIKIYNATRGGKLEVFPRVDFDSLFE